MPSFVKGVIKYQDEVHPKNQGFFEKLTEGQSPEALFITCSDSRIETAMITQTGPGELFICRNAGNIVPPHTNHPGGITASIEYAITVLNVPNIIVCGHTYCGAMAGAMSPETLKGMGHVARWLYYAKAAVDIVKEKGAELSEEERMEMLIEQNVILQLQHLKTHPSVAVKLASDAIKLHGWVYDIKDGKVNTYAPEQDKFIPIKEKYAAIMAETVTEGTCDHK